MNKLDSYFFGGPACLSDRLWFYGYAVAMVLIGLITLANILI